MLVEFRITRADFLSDIASLAIEAVDIGLSEAILKYEIEVPGVSDKEALFLSDFVILVSLGAYILDFSINFKQ